MISPISSLIPGPTPNFMPKFQHTKQFQYLNTTTWMKGRHQIKGGFDILAPLKNEFFDVAPTRGNLSFNGQFTGNAFADTGESLRSAFAKNPHMKLFVGSGFYDLATPYFATQYTLSHLGLDASLKGSISTGYYEAGHMMYIDTRELARLRKDVGAFVESALGKK